MQGKHGKWLEIWTPPAASPDTCRPESLAVAADRAGSPAHAHSTARKQEQPRAWEPCRGMTELSAHVDGEQSVVQRRQLAHASDQRIVQTGRGERNSNDLAATEGGLGENAGWVHSQSARENAPGSEGGGRTSARARCAASPADRTLQGQPQSPSGGVWQFSTRKWQPHQQHCRPQRWRQPAGTTDAPATPRQCEPASKATQW